MTVKGTLVVVSSDDPNYNVGSSYDVTINETTTTTTTTALNPILLSDAAPNTVGSDVGAVQETPVIPTDPALPETV